MTTTISGSNGIVFPDATSMQTGQQAVKAWVNFNGTGVVAIRAGYNVSSITDNNTGYYTVNFATAMPDANYVTSCFSAEAAGAAGTSDRMGNISRNSGTYLASSVAVICTDVGAPANMRDQDLVVVSIFR